MYEVKINKRGQITIPKPIRDSLGLVPGITLNVNDYDRIYSREIVVAPVVICHHCRKALPDEFIESRACPDCPPLKIIQLY